jgi:hypothetical protein
MTRRNPAGYVLAAGLLLRLFIAFRYHNIIAPDEVFQSLEQAHRLVFGQGIVPWEFQVGLRNWAIPLVLAAPMALMKLFTPDPLAGLLLIRLLLCLASLGIVWTGLRWGARFGGVRGAWIAGLFTALWPDLWLMAPHPLEEVFAADLLVPAVYLISTGERRHAAWAALLLGGVFTLRLQLAPAVAIAGIALCGRDLKRWLVALPVAALPVLAAGLLDWVTWGQPFRSFWLNVYLNLGLGVAAREFGVSPPSYFLYMLALDWLWTLPVVAFLVARGGRFLPLAGGLVVVIILTHTAISHKELRFIFPAIALAVPLAGVGLAALTAEITQTRLRLGLAAALLAGPIISPWVWFMLAWQTSAFAAFEALAAQPPCLVAVGDWDKVFLPFDELFTGDSRVMALQPFLAGSGPAPDFIIAAQGSLVPPAGFALRKCYAGTWIPLAREPSTQFCVWSRPAVSNPDGPAPPFAFPFPKAALPFRIKDRLTG